jgi:acetate kinase
VNLLVPNLGSTSLKYQIVAMPSEKPLAKGRLERVRDYREAIGQIQTGGARIDAVVFKAVLAGPHYRGTFLIDRSLIEALEEYLPASPAHNAIYLAGIRAFQEKMPDVPLVAAFETEFHATMPEYARRYGTPGQWWGEGVQKYGFHGASHEFIAGRAPEFLNVARESLRLISCHLGGSSSLCAVQGGRSVDTSMGFSPQSGLENATRHGELDAFAVLYMMERHGWSTAEVRRQLAQTGGLAGISSIAGGDVRDLEEAERGGNALAGLALKVFAYQVKKTIGAYTAAMGGVDAIAFTGGIGENSALLRAGCCSGLEFLGIRLDPERNEQGQGDRLVSAEDAPVKVLTLATNEEIVVARRAYRCLTASRAVA